MDKNVLDQRKKIMSGITIVLLVGMAVFFLLSVKLQITSNVMNGVMIAFLVVFWLIMDIVEPRILHELDGISPEQMKAYYIYTVLGLVGYGGIAYFVITLGNGSNSGIMGAAVYALAMSGKRKFKAQYLGLSKED